MTVTGQQLADAALSFVGTPFKHRGRAPGLGLDCVGVPICAAALCGMIVPEPGNYGPSPHPEQLRAALCTAAEEVAVDQARAGDMLLFAYRTGSPAHFAVWDGKEMLVHAYEPAGRVVVHELNRAWLSRLVSCWRLLGVTHG